MKNKIVEITYQDTTQLEDMSLEELKISGTKIIKAVGFLVHENSEFIIIVYNFDTNTQKEHDALIIPKGCIIYKRILK